MTKIKKGETVFNLQSGEFRSNGLGRVMCLSFYLVLFCVSASFAQSKTIIDEWGSVQAPKPPELKAVKIDDPKSTAYLVLDMVKQTCNNERRPRCVASVPKVQAFLTQARSKGLSVIYSYTSSSTPADIFPELAPLPGEPLVRASADKFVGTDLEKILKDKGIKTVIVIGTAAHGAVISTGTQAAFRGFKVIVPVDGMSSESTYFEQYTAYHFTQAPGVAQQSTLTKFEMIQF
ncbi:MAG: cysteine hydrolase [Candidatus Binatia bacterium]